MTKARTMKAETASRRGVRKLEETPVEDLAGSSARAKFRRVFGLLLSPVALLCCADAAVDESKLPPPANTTIDFARDIEPVFEAICLRCHGPERPKSHFRLDNRESALKGGDNGVDIIPGNSAKSPLIHYIARLVPDLEMPPQGKGEPLTPQQVSLFRAWIDQG